MRTTSATGNRRLFRLRPGDGRDGFTFFEVMVTVAIVSVGLVLVYQSLFVCLNAYVSYTNRLIVSVWMNEKLWQAEESILKAPDTVESAAEGEFMCRGRPVSWSMSVDSARGPYLYRAKLTCSWNEGRRVIDLSREVHVLCTTVETEEDSP